MAQTTDMRSGDKRKFVSILVSALGLLLGSCRQTPSESEVAAACRRGNAEITSIEFGEAYVSTDPERDAGVPPHVIIHPVKVTYRFPAFPERNSAVERNVYTNLFGELVCD